MFFREGWIVKLKLNFSSPSVNVSEQLPDLVDFRFPLCWSQLQLTASNWMRSHVSFKYPTHLKSPHEEKNEISIQESMRVKLCKKKSFFVVCVCFLSYKGSERFYCQIKQSFCRTTKVGGWLHPASSIVIVNASTTFGTYRLSRISLFEQLNWNPF